MRKGTSSNANPRQRAWQIVVGYNLPFVLWTMYAFFRKATPLPGWSCPLKQAFHHCPGCGLTRAYTDLLTGNGLSNLWLACILVGFAINAICSFQKAEKVLHRAEYSNGDS